MKWTQADLDKKRKKANKQRVKKTYQATEHQLQAAFVKWTRMPSILKKYPSLKLLYAIHNGGKRHISVAKKLKNEGTNPGIPDICLPVGFNGNDYNYHALYIEFKAITGKLSPEQREKINLLEAENNYVYVCYGDWLKAKKVVIHYLSDSVVNE